MPVAIRPSHRIVPSQSLHGAFFKGASATPLSCASEHRPALRCATSLLTSVRTCGDMAQAEAISTCTDQFSHRCRKVTEYDGSDRDRVACPIHHPQYLRYAVTDAISAVVQGVQHWHATIGELVPVVHYASQYRDPSRSASNHSQSHTVSLCQSSPIPPPTILPQPTLCTIEKHVRNEAVQAVRASERARASGALAEGWGAPWPPR